MNSSRKRPLFKQTNASKKQEHKNTELRIQQLVASAKQDGDARTFSMNMDANRINTYIKRQISQTIECQKIINDGVNNITTQIKNIDDCVSANNIRIENITKYLNDDFSSLTKHQQKYPWNHTDSSDIEYKSDSDHDIDSDSDSDNEPPLKKNNIPTSSTKTNNSYIFGAGKFKTKKHKKLVKSKTIKHHKKY